MLIHAHRNWKIDTNIETQDEKNPLASEHVLSRIALPPVLPLTVQGLRLGDGVHRCPYAQGAPVQWMLHLLWNTFLSIAFVFAWHYLILGCTGVKRINSKQRSSRWSSTLEFPHVSPVAPPAHPSC